MLPAAATISARSTLNYLDGPFRSMADGVSENLYCLWLGSGISFGRVPGLRHVIKRVLGFLQEQVVHGDSDCRFRKALISVIELTSPSGVEWARTDMERPVDDWPDHQQFINRLVDRYADMLDVHVEDEASDFLLWAGVDVPGTYANTLIGPDAEHLCIALLAIEGVASEIASANWDGLVEKAIAELSNGANLNVFVRSEDMRNVPSGPRLYKFHGCAVKAKQDAANYRSKLVGRQSQINSWISRPENAQIASELINMIASKRTLMVGLSAQDSNIQGLFAQAQTRMEWPWPSPDLAYVFSENELGISQLGLLQNVYPSAYSAKTRTQIYNEALIRAFAKPLLVALVLHVLCTKLRALAADITGGLDAAGRLEIGEGIVVLRNAVADTVEDYGHEPFVRELIAQSGRALSLFRDGKVPPMGSSSYSPLSRDTVTSTLRDPNLPASGLREMGVSLGILGMGISGGHWSIKAADRLKVNSGALRVGAVAGEVAVFFAANAHAAMRLYTNGCVAKENNAVIVHSLEIPLVQSRSPRAAPGRTGKLMLREISITELIASSSDAATLFKRFREESVL